MVLIVLGLLLSVTVAVFVVLPRLIVWQISTRLPLSVVFPAGRIEVSVVSTEAGSALKPELQMLLPGARGRTLASDVSGWWVPPGLLRSGQRIEGTLVLPILRSEPFAWQVLVGGITPTPAVNLIVNGPELSRFLFTQAQTVVEFAGQEVMRCIYVVDEGTITDDPEPGSTGRIRSRVEARGSIILTSGGRQRTLRVNRLAGHAVVTFVPVSGGLRPVCTLAIEESDADALEVPVLGDARPFLLKQLEKAANEGMAKSMDALVLPTWFPTDVRIEAQVLRGSLSPTPAVPSTTPKRESSPL